ncbi:MAG TPA: EamA family transporter [Candidatus Sulfotelmatobacter sp.]
MLISTVVPALSHLGPAAFSVAAFFLWGTSDFVGGYASRRANAFVVTAFSHVCALILMTTAAMAQGDALPDRTSILWAIAAGAVGGFSLAIFYRTLASGQMGLIAPISALIGAAIPTLLDIALEGTPSRWTIAGFALAILAIWLITRPERTSSTERSGRPTGIAMAALAGVGFAGFYVFVHQAHGSSAWIAGISRIGSLTATGIAVLVTGAPLSLNRRSIALGALAGCADITASALFIYASQHGRMDQAVVITSLYPAVTVLLARLVLKEHFSRWKFVGLLAALAAVPLISAG